MTGPRDDHPIRIEPNPNRVRVRHGGQVIADTTRALTLYETNYPPVVYIPRADADMSLLRRSTHQTRCPYKGLASYFTIAVGERTVQNAIWSYEAPYPEVAAIAGHLAFYTDRVDGFEVISG